MEIKGRLISELKKEKVKNKEIASFYIMSNDKKIYCTIQADYFNKIDKAKQGDEFFLTGNLKEIKYTKNDTVYQNNIFTVDTVKTIEDIKLNKQLQKAVGSYDLKGIKKSVSDGADILSLTKEHFIKLSSAQKNEIKKFLNESLKVKISLKNIISNNPKLRL